MMHLLWQGNFLSLEIYELHRIEYRGRLEPTLAFAERYKYFRFIGQSWRGLLFKFCIRPCYITIVFDYYSGAIEFDFH